MDIENINRKTSIRQRNLKLNVKMGVVASIAKSFLGIRFYCFKKRFLEGALFFLLKSMVIVVILTRPSPKTAA